MCHSLKTEASWHFPYISNFPHLFPFNSNMDVRSVCDTLLSKGYRGCSLGLKIGWSALCQHACLCMTAAGDLSWSRRITHANNIYIYAFRSFYSHLIEPSFKLS